MIEGTFSNNKTPSITLEDMLRAVEIARFEYPDIEYKSPGMFERFMNRIGWYRKREIILIDKSKFSFQPFDCTKTIL